MTESGVVRRPGCQSCRARHIKCDKGDPCGQCVKKGRACLRGTKLKFRHITVASETGKTRTEPQYEFSETQRWCRINGKRLRFIDETAEVNNIHNEDFDSDEDAVSEDDTTPSLPRPSRRVARISSNNHRPPNSYQTVTADTPASVATDLFEASPRPIQRGQPYPLIKLPALHPHSSHDSPGSTGSLFPDEPPPPRTYTPVCRAHLSGPIGTISSIGSNSWNEDPSPPEPRRCYQTDVFPLRDLREAELVRLFVDFFAAAFDFGDPLNRFSALLPQQAALSPLLLNAMLAVAANFKDQAGVLVFFDKPADHYFNAAFESLDPFLSADLSEVEETHIIAAVLLRMYPAINGPELAPEATRPTRALWEFLTSWRGPLAPGSLCEGAAWVWIQLEIFRSVMHQEPFNLRLDGLELDRSLQPADDFVWAYRMILHTVDVIMYCFGGERGSKSYEELTKYAAQWIASVPDSFMPVFIAPSAGEDVFPEVHLLNESVILGMQHYHLNRILLMAHNPNMPRLGKIASQSMDDEIVNDIKTMCGIAVSMEQMSPAYVCACMGIALGGDRLQLRSEQEAVCKVFATTAEAFGWGPSWILHHLKEAWGWPQNMAAEAG
ncbi:Adhesion and hyphal regulator 1 [Colletotrichum orbiculare MAFF 240422]|uniref:Adhesion and hyphal regulator 1 n=1 Tax=Colletotrichum orbiculare (strain 104-T / ATCC 96160 / CBS 514.97 / LARS 414 / MAFF 240422) TaxID=1213857 RepID=A0A484G205_COLOR|nr:Adhesion and hyphal regulator 1 [Colletotrichum orbiculare MAFF 240422]